MAKRVPADGRVHEAVPAEEGAGESAETSDVTVNRKKTRQPHHCWLPLICIGFAR